MSKSQVSMDTKNYKVTPAVGKPGREKRLFTPRILLGIIQELPFLDTALQYSPEPNLRILIGWCEVSLKPNGLMETVTVLYVQVQVCRV